MKIDEALEAINGCTTVAAKNYDSEIRIYGMDEKSFFYTGWFLCVPVDAQAWDAVDFDPDAIRDDVIPQDLARVMDVVQRLIDTPVKERFPEKKYQLRWINDIDGSENYLYNPGRWQLTSFKVPADVLTESEIEQLKRDNPRWAPAIDAMKEEVKDDEN